MHIEYLQARHEKALELLADARNLLVDVEEWAFNGVDDELLYARYEKFEYDMKLYLGENQ